MSRMTSRERSVSRTSSKDVDALREEVGLGAEEKGKDNTRMLVVSFVLMVFFGLGNKVFQKLMTIPMHGFRLYPRVFRVHLAHVQERHYR